MRKVHKSRTHRNTRPGVSPSGTLGAWAEAGDSLHARNSKRFHSSNFTYCLTLSSEFFSSFPHGTCALSVSRPIFSLRWNLPPIWSCNPKQLDSLRAYHIAAVPDPRRDSHPLRSPVPEELYPDFRRKCFFKLQHLRDEPDGFQIWTIPASLAVTGGINVFFFSSTY